MDTFAETWNRVEQKVDRPHHSQTFVDYEFFEHPEKPMESAPLLVAFINEFSRIYAEDWNEIPGQANIAAREPKEITWGSADARTTRSTRVNFKERTDRLAAVSYTHLTLPTILRV